MEPMKTEEMLSDHTPVEGAPIQSARAVSNDCRKATSAAWLALDVKDWRPISVIASKA
jgi:hypothetical protein